MLHLIFQSPIDQAVLDRMAKGDSAVFMGSAVLSLMKNGTMAASLKDKLSDHVFYALQEDLELRGIVPSEIVPDLQVIDYPALIKLTVTNEQVTSWN